MSILRYISHPNVNVEPDVPVPEWTLSDLGRERAEALLAQPWVGAVGRVVSSGERKARDTAAVLADHLGLVVEVRPAMGEIDRRSTGFVSHDRHEELADLLFARPTESAAGWETADAAQRRIVDATADLLVDADADVAVVGHGGVGTLLWCHLCAEPIARRHDQPGQGHFWSYDIDTGRMLHRWRPIDLLDV
ncbi:MAG: histidine phosphatase family protein [Acidimicrobiales bacterium]